MRKLALIFLSAFVAVAVAQVTLTFRKGDIEVRNYLGFSLKNQADGSLDFSMSRRKTGTTPISGAWTSQGLAFQSDRVEGSLAKEDAQRQRLVRSLTLTGSVKTVKTATGPAPATTEMTTPKAVYQVQNPYPIATAEGPLRVVNIDPAKSRTSVITGSAGRFVLEAQGTKSPRTVRTGTIRGRVTIDVKQASKENASNFTAVGDRLEIDYVAVPNTLKLIGNVTLTGASAEDFGNVQGAQIVILTLNEKGEWTEVEVRGEPTVVSVKTPRKGGGR